MNKSNFTGLGLIIAAGAFMFITIAWWLRKLHHVTYTSPEDLVPPLVLAFVSGILCTYAALTVGGSDARN